MNQTVVVVLIKIKNVINIYTYHMIYISRMNERGSEQNMWRETCKTGECVNLREIIKYIFIDFYISYKDFFIKY